jgi:regulator of RNase E activity RraA
VNRLRVGIDDGVIVSPSDIALLVLERAEQLTAVEQPIRADVAGRLSLQNALEKYGHV